MVSEDVLDRASVQPRRDRRRWLACSGTVLAGALLGLIAYVPLWVLWYRTGVDPRLLDPADQEYRVSLGLAVWLAIPALAVVLCLLTGTGLFVTLVLRLPARVALPVLLVAFAVPTVLGGLHLFGWTPSTVS